MKKTQVAILMIGILIGLALLSWYVLPQQVILEVNRDGYEPTMLSKGLAILAPAVFSGIGIYRYTSEDERRQKANILLVVVGYILSILLLLMNH